MQVVTLSFFRFEGIANKLWAFGQMQFAHKPMSQIPGIGFYKLFGSGSGESFTPFPNFGVYAVLATWPSLDHAQTSIEKETVFQKYRDHAFETATLYLKTYHAWGEWDSQHPFAIDETLKLEKAPEPIGVITRATIKKRSFVDFWKSVPDISEATTREGDLLFKLGIGEIPWLHQVTFSVWSDRAAMMRFAYQGGCHAKAAKDAHEKNWFSEELFARFAIINAEGTWQGKPVCNLVSQSPLQQQSNAELY